MEHVYIFVLIASLTIASPGPGVFLTLSNALNYDFKSAFFGIIGVALGMGVISIIAATSLGVIITTSQALLGLIKIIGAIYLAYLGYKLLRAPSKRISEIGSYTVRSPSASLLFRQGFFVSLFNPKPIVFFMALFPQFINKSEPFTYQFVFLLSIFFILLVAIHSFYGASVSKLKKKLSDGKAFGYLNRVGGSVFIIFSITLLVSSFMQYIKY